MPAEFFSLGVPKMPPPGQHGIQVLFFSFTPNLAESDAAQTALSDAEQLRADLFKQRIDRNRYVVGRTILRCRIATILGCGPKEGALALDRGRPFLEGTQSQKIEFNLSHSGECVVVAFSNDRPLGIDVEVHRDFPDMQGVAKRIMTNAEYEEFAELPSRERVSRFFRIWVRKEAIMKCLGAGFSIDPRRIEVGHSPNPFLEAEFNGERFHLRSIDVTNVTEEHSCAIAWPAGSDDAEIAMGTVEGTLSRDTRIE